MEGFFLPPLTFNSQGAMLLTNCGTVETPVAPAVEVSTAEPATGAGELLQAAVVRDESPEVSPATMGNLVQGNNRFAFDSYHMVWRCCTSCANLRMSTLSC